MIDGENPFIILARITVKEGLVNDYLAIAEEADKAVERTEEGMLFHNFDADPDDPNKFVWTEVYRRSEDFIFHADNPPVGDYVAKHSELATHFSIEIYGNVFYMNSNNKLYADKILLNILNKNLKIIMENEKDNILIINNYSK